MNKLDYSTLNNIISESKQVMVYGWLDCNYKDLIEDLKKEDSPIKRVFDFSIGRPNNFYTTLEERSFEQINPIPLIRKKISPEKDGAQYCKAGITNLILENYKREKIGLPLIPLIFCVDIDDNSHHNNSVTLSSKEDKYNRLITHKELRRCYKLCKELESSEGLCEIAKIAQKTIKFVKLTKTTTESSYKLQEVKPFWEKEDWLKNWNERMALSTPRNPLETTRWRMHLEKSVLNFNNLIK